MDAQANPPRSWRIIARELAQAVDSEKVLKLSQELAEVLSKEPVHVSPKPSPIEEKKSA